MRSGINVAWDVRAGYLGLRSPVGEADVISKTLQLVKVCSAQFVSELVKRALPGLTLTHMQVPPSAISAKVDSQYFVVTPQRAVLGAHHADAECRRVRAGGIAVS